MTGRASRAWRWRNALPERIAVPEKPHGQRLCGRCTESLAASAKLRGVVLRHTRDARTGTRSACLTRLTAHARAAPRSALGDTRAGRCATPSSSARKSDARTQRFASTQQRERIAEPSKRCDRAKPRPQRSIAAPRRQMLRHASSWRFRQRACGAMRIARGAPRGCVRATAPQLGSAPSFCRHARRTSAWRIASAAAGGRVLLRHKNPQRSGARGFAGSTQRQPTGACRAAPDCGAAAAPVDWRGYEP
jgi:hypothetical protein